MDNKESAARASFQAAIVNHDENKIRSFLSSNNAKELLLAKDARGFTSLHLACSSRLATGVLQLLLDAAVEHGIIQQMLEAKNICGATCLHFAQNFSTDSLGLLLEYLLKHADIKKMLEAKNNDGRTCLHTVCYKKLSADSFRLLLEYVFKHADIKKMLEEKDKNGLTCLHLACDWDLAIDSFRLLLEYLLKHGDIKKTLEEEDKYGWTCLHHACAMNLSPDSLRLLISFFHSNESFQLVLGSKVSNNRTPLDLAKAEEHKQLLQDPDCWRKCRYWLFCSYRDTFLNSLYPNSPEKTLEALQELAKNYADDEILNNTTLHQQNFVEALQRIPHDESAARYVLELEAMSTTEDFHRDHIIQLEKVEVQQLITDLRKLIFVEASNILYDDESTARQALELEAMSTTEDFHRDHIIQLENVDFHRLISDFQRLKPLSEEERDRQELEKLIFDRLSRDRLMKEAVPILFEHGVTKESFFLLKESDFRDMKIKIGPMRQLLQIIEKETFRRSNLSARSDLSSRPRSSGHTPRIGVVPSIALSTSALIQQHQYQIGDAPPPASKDSGSDEQQQSFVATANSEVETENGGSESYISGPTATSS